MAARKYVVSISELENDDNLGEKTNQLIKLRKAEFLIPDTFVIKAKAYFDFIKENNLEKKIKHLLGVVDLEKTKSIKDTAEHIKKHMSQSSIPAKILDEILSSYKEFGGILNHRDVNVFLSHLIEHNEQKVKGDASLVNKIKDFWTSIYSPLSPKSNPTIIVQKIIKGKNGKIRTSSKQIRTSFSLSQKEIQLLESLVAKFKKEFYLPHEIDWVIDKNKIYVLKIKPETHLNMDKTYFPETHYRIIKNSNHSA